MRFAGLRRFPDSGRDRRRPLGLDARAEDHESRGDCIADILKYLDAELDGKAYLTADIFGYVTIASTTWASPKA